MLADKLYSVLHSAKRTRNCKYALLFHFAVQCRYRRHVVFDIVHTAQLYIIKTHYALAVFSVAEENLPAVEIYRSAARLPF